MASGRILQTLTWLSAIALGRSDVVLFNALNRSDKFLSAAEGLKCHTLRRRLGNPLRLSSLEGFGPHHSIIVEMPVGGSFDRSGAKHSREHKNKRNFSSWRQVAKKWHARARSPCEE